MSTELERVRNDVDEARAILQARAVASKDRERDVLERLAQVCCHVELSDHRLKKLHDSALSRSRKKYEACVVARQNLQREKNRSKKR